MKQGHWNRCLMAVVAALLNSTKSRYEDDKANNLGLQRGYSRGGLAAGWMYGLGMPLPTGIR